MQEAAQPCFKSTLRKYCKSSQKLLVYLILALVLVLLPLPFFTDPLSFLLELRVEDRKKGP